MSFVKKVGLPRLIISLLFFSVLVLAVILDMPIGMMTSDVLKRFGMFGILVLAMVPAIQSGTGPNFGLSIGITCGLIGIVTSIELGLGEVAVAMFGGMDSGVLSSVAAYETLSALGYFIGAIIISIPLSLIAGIAYGKLLNAVKGSEMTIATYIGFSIVQFMCIGWILLPYRDGKMIWPIGNGLRVTFTLKGTFAHVLNDMWQMKFRPSFLSPSDSIVIPTGLILFFLLVCGLVYLYTRSKTGVMIRAAGKNPMYAKSCGMEINRGRIIANVLSTTLGAIGIIVYSQSYGFVQLYTAPLMMAFAAVASVLIGGATAKRASISHAIIGVFLFQGLLTTALPVANVILPEGNLSEMIRMVVQNGIILYALTKVDGRG